ncbi:ABC transporter ATP-binding protein [Pseudogemmobacter humi]|uniref:Spermidine/putrescine import ATP-binding protein PotA n=1 Tax=Pseudogemmobacter humi TaxID=2483812 RepID=A0A3P5X7V1_9RHOB|nr:ABC transporter ATP-binding protein [Pseudogemmobacter humi]VDC23424.1 Spermidine/putrescine import ATP-binding protein PotA [Pseudogemmobacter humi]
MSHSVDLIDVEMVFGTVHAVRKLSAHIEAGEFFSILGPSGCGKTTLLRLIAGFNEPTSGKVLIGGKDMAGIPADRRPTAMIFQSLALFPLMPVWENIAFGLEARGVPKAGRRKKAEELLDLIALPGYGNRMVHELSGGQRQRVAIARALAVEPQVLLLDEPLSALDLKLRQHMRAELRALQKRTGVTFVYITHDQSEALAMSDRVAVMEAGVLQQIATPQELYANPATPFVARFIGETNEIAGKVTGVENGLASIDTAQGSFTARAGAGVTAGAAATLFVRPETMSCSRIAMPNSLPAKAVSLEYEGALAMLRAETDQGQVLLATLPNRQLADAPQPGERIWLSFAADEALVMGAGDGHG